MPIHTSKFRDKSEEAVNTTQEILKQLQRMTIKVPKTRRCKWQKQKVNLASECVHSTRLIKCAVSIQATGL